MRKMIIVLAATGGFGLLSSGGAIAAPFGGAALDTAATAASSVIDVGYGRCCRPKPPKCYYVKKKVCVGCCWKWVKIKVCKKR
jgi:hypothetical protein